VWAILGIELEYRQQFDCVDSEFPETGYLLNQAGIGAAHVFGKPGTGMPGKVPYVRVIDDCPVGRAVKAFVSFPIICAGVHHYALHRLSGVVSVPAGGLPALISGNGYSAAIRSRRTLDGSTQPVRRIDWPPNSIAIKLVRPHAGYELVPVVVGHIGDRIETMTLDHHAPG